MPTVVVVLPSTTYRAADFVRAAGDLGIDLIVASEQPPPFDMGDAYLQIDCTDPQIAAEAIVRVGDRASIDGIVAADDGGVVVAALAGSRLGLRANHPDAARATRDKSSQRSLLAVGEVPQPRFATLERDDDPVKAARDIGYPLVVKPLDRSAAQGVVKADDEDGLRGAVIQVHTIVGQDAPLLVESYMPGAEIALEGLVIQGGLVELAIFDKPDAGSGPSFPETILVTPSRLGPVAQDECRRVAEASVRALGLTHGPVHIEMKVENDVARVIEVAARSIGGLCSRSLNFGLMGTSLETLILRNALGMDKTELHREPTSSGVLMIPITRAGRLVSVDGIDRVRGLEGITGVDITIPLGEQVAPPPVGDRYLGFVFAKGPGPALVEASLREAMSSMRLIIE
ncbi:MAG: ATP-grasp domain-containing protein [Acidimicrobiia bacterium]